LLNNIFINWVNHINNLNIFLFKSLDKWRSSSSGSRFSGNNINVFLVFFLSSKILLSEIISSPDLDVWYLRSSANFCLLFES
jgi:hypothetical protein